MEGAREIVKAEYLPQLLAEVVWGGQGTVFRDSTPTPPSRAFSPVFDQNHVKLSMRPICFIVAVSHLLHCLAPHACYAFCGLAERFFIGKRKDGRRKEAQTSAELKAAVSQEYSRSRDFKSQIDVHNACVGIKTVASAAKKTCKCHGPSGSCVMKTCWIQLPAFIASGETLKSLYQRSSLGRTINEAQITNRASRLRYPRTSSHRRLKGRAGATWRKGRQRGVRNNILKVFSERCVSRGGGKGWAVLGDPSQLVYLDASPNFCYKSKYGPGTRGRSCEKGQSCSDLCCGRGYDTSVAKVMEPCKCRVVWCCEVKCLNCTRVAELYTCK
ncbi:Protein Wnt-9a [Portunus trituberculatus]|uniref:Protein Wnt n=1 Tax=Portunus trituberculatus TaxID=210409 RepID=A0A5B7CS12_PORTR|nr:Protein Wnt-9a [Portunus trituberculatus]